jgi:uncharacterized protein
MMQPHITTIPLRQMASGDRLFLQLYQFVGAQPGKKIYLQANLHGAELAGNAVLHQLMEWLMTLDATQLHGEIWLVPVCNPLGVNQRMAHFAIGRYNLDDGKDWNRIFWDYEKEAEDLVEFAESQFDLDPQTIQQNYRQRIQASFRQQLEKLQKPSGAPFYERYRYQLQSLCLDADYVLDLHTASDQGLTYLYYFPGREASAQLFPFPAGILLDEYDGDAFDEAFIKPWLALEACLTSLGRPIQFEVEAFTLELGTGMQINPDAVSQGLNGIKTYLSQKGFLPTLAAAIAPDSTSEMRLVPRSQVTKYYAPTGGMVQNRVSLGSKVVAGQPLYEILCFNKTGKLPAVTEICAESEGLVFDVSLNQAVNEGEYVLGTL